MILAPRLNGFCPVELFQNHDASQMVGEGHCPHGEAEICPLLDTGGHAEGGADQKAGAGFAGIFHVPELVREGFAGQFLPFGGEDAEPRTLGNFGEDQLGFLFQSRLNLAGGRIFGKPCFRQLEKGKGAVSAQTLFLFLGGGNVEFFLELAHGDQGDAEHGKSPFVFPIVYHFQTGNAT